MTDTTFVLTIEYQILLSILSTSWLVPPPVLVVVVVGGFGLVSVPGVVLGVGSPGPGGIGRSVGIGGAGLGGHGPGSGILLLPPVI